MAARPPPQSTNFLPRSPLDTLARQASVGRSPNQPPSQRNDPASHSRMVYLPSTQPVQQPRLPQSQFQPGPTTTGSPLLHTQFPSSSTDTSASTMNASWDSSAKSWPTDRTSEDDAYGGMEDYYDPFAAPEPVLLYSQPTFSKAPSHPKSAPPSQPPSQKPLLPLNPPTPLRHPSIRSIAQAESHRESAASSRSAYSQQQLGVDWSSSDNRSTWRSDVSGSTTADAFAFREYESPQPPRVIITGPLTPQKSPDMQIPGDEQQNGWNWNEYREHQQPPESEDESTTIVVSPPQHLEEPKSASIDALPASASGKTRSLYNAANFSRPIRGTASTSSEGHQADLLERPDSVASSYSTSSSTYATPPPPVPRITTPRRQNDTVIVPQSILRSSSYSSAASSNPSSDGSAATPKSVTRKPSIRFQDPRPPPPVPPPPPPMFYVPPGAAPTRSLSTSGRGGPPQPSQSQPQMMRSRSTGSASPRAQILEQARNRPPPLPPTSSPMGLGGLAAGPSPTSRNANGIPSPTDQPYDRYSYYDPELVARGSPSSPRGSPRFANPDPLPTPSHSATNSRSGRSKASTPDPHSEANPQTAEDYLQLGITHHLANRLVESAYCFEISAKGIGALKGRPSGSSGGHVDETGESGCGVGMLMWGLTLRSGWGVEKDEKKGFNWLRRAAEHAVDDLEVAKTGQESGALKTELVLAIYEVGQCFFHGWGVPKDQKMAVSYFLVAARLGDSDAQQELGFCYDNGKGCKKDRKEAAKWYRLAAAQGASTVGLAWIYKDKYM